MSARLGTRLVAVLLVSCGGAVGTGAPERSVTPAERPETVEEATVREATAEQECRREWPDDPSDPRVGFYVFERALEGSYAAAPTSFYRFHGATLSSVWFGTTNLPPDCTYGRIADIPPVSVQTFHAHVTDDGYLFALVPCFGWKQIGHFVEGDRFQDYLFGILRRVPVDDRDTIYSAPMSHERVDLFFECREPYEAPNEPIPPRPE